MANEKSLVGDVVSDNGSTTAGGLGFAAGGNIGDNHAMFEPIHGSAPRYAGQNKVNPSATILSARMMLDWLGVKYGDKKLVQAAELVELAVIDVLKEGKVATYDFGGSSSCSEFGDEVNQALIKRYITE